jgi:lysozyme
MTPAGVARLQAEEGFRSVPYQDTTGHWTVGFGTNLDAGITRPMAAAWMLETLAQNRNRLEGLAWFDAIVAPAQDVIEDMAYNLGIDGMLQFHDMIAALSQTPPDYARAADAMRDSFWARQVPNRAGPLADAMEKCQPPTS